MIRKIKKRRINKQVNRLLGKKRRILDRKRLAIRRRRNNRIQRKALLTKRMKQRKLTVKRLQRIRSTRRMILVIDHSVPLYDKDTGSRNMYQYLQLFIRMGLDVKFFGADGIRHEPYTTTLEQLGIDLLSNKYKGQQFISWLRKQGRRIDYVYLLRPNIAGIYMDQVRKYTQAKIIYNGVDFHYLREQRKYEIDLNPATLASANQFKEQEFKLFAKSDVIYTVSDYEKSILDQEMPGKRVVVVPTYIYDQPFPLGENNGFAERTAITFVGGFAHLPNVDGILWFVREVFPLISREISDVTLTIIGSNPPQEIVSLNSDHIKVTGYISDDELRAYYSLSRVVVAPIRFGAGVKGKIIEASAYGIPVVTTPIGAEGIIDVNEIANSAESPEQFASQIIDLYCNQEKWLDRRNRQIHYAERYLNPSYALSILSQDIRGS